MIRSNKTGVVSVIYHAPSPNNCELDSFLSKINKCKPSLAVITGDFNARSPV